MESEGGAKRREKKRRKEKLRTSFWNVPKLKKKKQRQKNMLY